MLNEKQIFEAKVFLRSYKDAILCLEQTVIKKETFNHFKVKYQDISSESQNKEALELFKFSR